MSAPAKPILGSAFMFASNGALFASLLPWYPVLKNDWHLSSAVFGIMVACFAVGSVLSSAAPAQIVARFGPSRTVIGGTAAMAVGLIGAGFAGNPLMFGVVLLFLGFLDPVVDVAQNLVAVRVESKAGTSIMSSLHACWSLGAAGGGALGTFLVSRISMPLHLGIGALLATALAILGCLLVGKEAPPTPHEHEEQSGGFPKGAAVLVALPLVLVAVSGTVVEEASNSWAALAAHDIAGINITHAGSAFTLALVAQCVGRFLGDPMINRWGRVRVGRMGGFLIAAGGGAIMVAQGPIMLIAGFAAAGFGCATIVPSAFVAASQLKGMSAGTGLTLLSWLMRLGYLFTSPIIGGLASLTSLRWALGILVLAGTTIVVLGDKLSPRDRQATSTSNSKQASADW